jgi:cell wall-associated NlpC family hydrolase
LNKNSASNLESQVSGLRPFTHSAPLTPYPKIILAFLLLFILPSCVSLKTSGPGGGTRELVVRAAKNQLDKFYAYGKQDSYEGFDCSGLAQYAYNEAGIKIPRTVKQQFEQCQKVDKGALKPGDLVFFTTYAPGATHVGIFIGDGKFIHSPTTGKKVDISGLDNTYWSKAFYGAGTYIK